MCVFLQGVPAEAEGVRDLHFGLKIYTKRHVLSVCGFRGLSRSCFARPAASCLALQPGLATFSMLGSGLLESCSKAHGPFWIRKCVQASAHALLPSEQHPPTHTHTEDTSHPGTTRVALHALVYYLESQTGFIASRCGVPRHLVPV